MSFSGLQLKERNEKICYCIKELKAQRNELNFLIEKQQEEKIKLQTEVERITYKLSLINKSLSQRIITRTNYDRTIKQAEDGYTKLVQHSGLLLDSVQKEANDLEQSMDKKVGTEISSVTSIAGGSVISSSGRIELSQISSKDTQHMERDIKSTDDYSTSNT